MEKIKNPAFERKFTLSNADRIRITKEAETKGEDPVAAILAEEEKMMEATAKLKPKTLDVESPPFTPPTSPHETRPGLGA